MPRRRWPRPRPPSWWPRKARSASSPSRWACRWTGASRSSTRRSTSTRRSPRPAAWPSASTPAAPRWACPRATPRCPRPIWFNVAKFPQATFKSTRDQGAGQRQVRGRRQARHQGQRARRGRAGADHAVGCHFHRHRQLRHQAAGLQDRRGRMGRHHGGGQRRDGEVQAGPDRPGRRCERRVRLAAACLAAGLDVGCAPAQAQAPNYAIDPTHTFVNYENGHYGTTTNRGRFSTKDGTLFFDRAGQTGQGRDHHRHLFGQHRGRLR